MNCSTKQTTIQDNICLPDIQAQEINGILYFTIERFNHPRQYWQTYDTVNGTILTMRSEPNFEYPN